MTADPSRGAGFTRNHLNLPDETTIPDSSGSIRYYYCADGQLVRQEERRSDAGVRVRDYCGSVEFLNGGIDQIRHENGYIYLDRDLTEEHLYLTGSETVNKTYESISTVSERTVPNPRVIDYISEEGIILIPGFDVQSGATFLADIDTFPVTGLIYRYFIKDHLGSVRAEFEDSSNIVVLKSQHHFYPFGCEHKGSWNQDTRNNHLYTGQERQGSFDLEYLRFFARHSDPLVMGRFQSTDPMINDPSNINSNPYMAMANNPIRYIDPLGLIWEDPRDAERLRNAVNQRRESIEKNNDKIQTKIEEGGLSHDKLARLESRLTENNQKIGLLNQSLEDIEAIGDAAEIYKLASPSSRDGTHGVVRGDDGVIKIEGSNTGLFIHEIRHVGQSLEAGGVRFNKDGRLLNAATTLSGARQNEVEAYQVQFSYDGSYPAGANTLKDINKTSLMNIKSSDGGEAYRKLKDLKRDK